MLFAARPNHLRFDLLVDEHHYHHYRIKSRIFGADHCIGPHLADLSTICGQFACLVDSAGGEGLSDPVDGAAA